MSDTTTRPLAGTFSVDPIHSSVGFALRHAVSTYHATFEKFSGQVVIGEEGVSLSGSAPVESVSIKEPLEFREHVVYGDDFFDGKNHPELTARSTDVVFGEDGTVTVTGDVTLRGVTKPVTATGTLSGPVEAFGATRAALELSATVDRRDWGLNWQMELPDGGDAVGYDVELTAHIELVKEG